MTLLLIAAGLVFPTLQGFFQGRVLDSESRRLLALTRYGQNRAVSEGVPMVLWIDTSEGAYGLAAAAGLSTDDRLEKRFTIDDDLALEVSESASKSGRYVDSMGLPLTVNRSLEPVRTADVRLTKDVAVIEFLPDGYIGLSSPEYVTIKEGELKSVWLVQDTNRLGYAISTEQPQRDRR
jgi:Tfp pilus assembly protein FimT